MSTANDLAATLDGVLNADDAASQAATETETEVTDNLEAAVKEATKTETKETPASETKSEKTEAKTVPYDRFSEVVAQKNEAAERLKTLEARFSETADREDKLRSRIDALEEDHNILEAIRELGKDPKHADTVNKIDKALQGIEEEEAAVEKAETKSDDKALEKAEKRLSAKQEELATALHDQKIEMLLEKSRTYSSELLNNLPEDYGKNDREVLGELLRHKINWNQIEKQGSAAIPEVIKSSFIDVVKAYGQPKGFIEKRVREDVTNEIPEEARPRTEEDVVNEVLGKNFSALDDDGKPVISDEDFDKDLATVLKATGKS